MRQGETGPSALWVIWGFGDSRKLKHMALPHLRAQLFQPLREALSEYLALREHEALREHCED